MTHVILVQYSRPHYFLSQRLVQGKPLAEARGEIQYSASFLDWYSGEARRIYGQVVPATATNRTHLHTREPIGVVALITPWNFPTAMIARKTGAALAVGCTVVVKPAEDTPLSALAFAEVGMQAGLPAGVFNVIPADRVKTAQISKYLCSSTDVDAISFTGSTAVGKLLLAQSADTVKRVCLELGGNAPVIVFPSADISVAVKGTMATKFRGSGQTCISANRIFVHSTIHDQYVNELQKAMKTLVIGDGMKAGVNQGPLINERAVKKIEELLSDAVSKGAKVVCGGKRGPQSTLFEPTLITGIEGNMEIAHTEIFGPIAAIVRYETEEEALKLANNTRTGLAGYIFTSDPSQMARVSRRLQVGMIGVNETMISCAEAAFGGVKESGLGREGAAQGIDEFSQWKYICTTY
uniref:Aldehyde dehydrogenase domain-containing protein n=1 Tax=Parascaris univalens TaxID=6257 RepID=A0A915ASG0_PARUN